VVDFSHYKVEGDTLLAELCVIQMCLDFCHDKSYNKIILEVIVWKSLNFLLMIVIITYTLMLLTSLILEMF